MLYKLMFINNSTSLNIKCKDGINEDIEFESNFNRYAVSGYIIANTLINKTITNTRRRILNIIITVGELICDCIVSQIFDYIIRHNVNNGFIVSCATNDRRYEHMNARADVCINPCIKRVRI